MNCLTQALVPKSQAAAQGLRDAYAWHQALWKTFPGRDGEDRHFLFRLDDRGDAFRVYLLSPVEPSHPAWGQWRTREIAPSFLEHGAYRFQLKVNPTMRRNADRRRIGIYAEDRLGQWMLRKGESSGFAVDQSSLIVGAPIDEKFRKNGREGKLAGVDFQGLLRVVERDAFKCAFRTGIGSAKAFGFGMLVLQPVRL